MERSDSYYTYEQKDEQVELRVNTGSSPRLTEFERLEREKEMLLRKNQTLETDISNISKHLRKLEQRHQNEIQSAENQSLMIKYQLVFIKIEAALTRVLNTQRIKNLKRKAKAFKLFEANVKEEALTQRNKASVYLQKIKSKLQSLIQGFKQSHRSAKSKSLSRWFNKTLLWKRAKSNREALQKRKAESELRGRKLQKELEAENERMLQQAAINEQLRAKREKYNEELVMLAAKEKDLASELEKAKQKDKVADSEEALDSAIAMNKREMHQLNELVGLGLLQIMDKKENIERLNAKYEASQANIATFLHDMGGVLESHEESLFGQTGAQAESSLEAEQTGPRLSGTGGFSKRKYQQRMH